MDQFDIDGSMKSVRFRSLAPAIGTKKYRFV